MTSISPITRGTTLEGLYELPVAKLWKNDIGDVIALGTTDD